MSVCTKEHAFYCFDVLCAHLAGNPSPSPTFEPASYPLFVTWNTIRPGHHPRLRGCIGNFHAMPLAQGLAEYALVSALEDTRFRPIQEKELSKLECCVSLLTDFEDVPGYLDWDIGVHGIYITIPSPGKRSRALTATYLPDVIPAQDWTKIEAVDSAIRKAGWDGVIDEAFRKTIKLRRYQSRLASVTWDEYIAWRSA